MDYLDKLSLRYPLVWLSTDEPVKTAYDIATSCDRPTFRLDPISGLSKFITSEQSWLPVLVESQDPETGDMIQHSIHDLGPAFNYLSKQVDAVFILEFASAKVESLFTYFINPLTKFRELFFKDDLTKLPFQMALLSHEDTPPPEIVRIAMRIAVELPDKDHFATMVNDLSKHITFSDSATKISESALGLTENEFIEAVLQQARENDKVVTASNINADRKKILKNSSVLDIREPTTTLADLGGLDNAKKIINQIKVLWNQPELIDHLPIKPIRKLLMIGVPGVGKSLICEAIANELKVELAKGGVSNAMNKYIGESEANVRRMFATIKTMAPIVFWIDELGRDLSGGTSSNQTDGGTTDRVHGEFLTGLQELPDNVFLAAAANRIDDLPPEMTRADRFDKMMFVGFPTFQERKHIFAIHLGDEYVSGYDLDELAGCTEFFTGAEIKSLIKTVRFDVGTTQYRHPTTSEIALHSSAMRGRVWVNHNAPILKMYKRALVEWDWASSQQRKEADIVLSSSVLTPKANPSSAKAMKFLAQK